MAAMFDIFRAGWVENWGSIPWTEAEAKYAADEMKLIILPELVSIATVDGVPAAFCLALPDFNEMIRDFDMMKRRLREGVEFFDFLRERKQAIAA